MSKILELREKRAKAWEAAKAFLDTERGNEDVYKRQAVFLDSGGEHDSESSA